MTPEARARQTIDALLTAAGWHVCDVASANLRAATGVAIREFPLDAGHGFADYLQHLRGKAVENPFFHRGTHRYGNYCTI